MARKHRLLGQRIAESFILAQVWETHEARYYLATEDGEAFQTDVALDLWLYNEPGVRGVLIVKRNEGETYVFQVEACKHDRRIRVAITPMRIPYSVIEAL
jgi:hypothetical protein